MILLCRKWIFYFFVNGNSTNMVSNGELDNDKTGELAKWKI